MDRSTDSSPSGMGTVSGEMSTISPRTKSRLAKMPQLRFVPVGARTTEQFCQGKSSGSSRSVEGLLSAAPSRSSPDEPIPTTPSAATPTEANANTIENAVRMRPSDNGRAPSKVFPFVTTDLLVDGSRWRFIAASSLDILEWILWAAKKLTNKVNGSFPRVADLCYALSRPLQSQTRTQSFIK
mmetsp:Transcript_24583/g.67852  ORF Transcript_24583/g.67852 Transcript_24583/m.67852 type:complete len:183 (-) Transcript_24583:85-633(-)